MTNQPRSADSARPFFYALAGTVLMAIAGLCFVNLNEGPQTFIVLMALFAAPGMYLLIAGAVARGMFVAGR
jgi:hypothetical protein